MEWNSGEKSFLFPLKSKLQVIFPIFFINFHQITPNILTPPPFIFMSFIPNNSSHIFQKSFSLFSPIWRKLFSDFYANAFFTGLNSFFALCHFLYKKKRIFLSSHFAFWLFTSLDYFMSLLTRFLCRHIFWKLLCILKKSTEKSREYICSSKKEFGKVST